jgi:peroxiredoxin
MSLETGRLAPPFTLLGLDGREYSLPRDLEGRPGVVVFVRSGCPTCDVAMPYYNRLREAYPSGWELWAVSQDPPERARQYATKFALPYPLLLDAPALAVSRTYDPPSTPTLFVVDEAGRIEYVSEGFAKADLTEVSALLAGRLGVEAEDVAPDGDGNPGMKPGCMSRHLFPARS